MSFQILLVNPSDSIHETNFLLQKIFPPVPPLSLMYLATYLEYAEYEVEIFDMFAQPYAAKKLLQLIAEKEFSVVAFSVLTSSFNSSFKLSQIIKKRFPHIYIVWGNIHATIFYREIIETRVVDYIVKGEGEFTFVSLIQSLEKLPNANLAEVDNICFYSQEKEKVVVTRTSLKVPVMNEILYPAAHLLNWDYYRYFPLFAISNERFSLISASRGCPYRCYFCAQDIMVKKSRYRDVKLVVDEMEYMFNQFGISTFIFADAYFPYSNKSGIEFCKELITRGLHKKIKWVTETRIDRVSKELLRLMKKAGLTFIMYGIESGGQRSIEKINKKIELSQAEEVVRWTHEAGLISIGLYVIGLPWETKEDCLATIKFSKLVNTDIAKFNVLIPYPGTPYYNEYFKDKKIDFESFNTWLSAFSSTKKTELEPVGKIPIHELNQLQRKAMISYFIQPHIMLNMFRKKIVTFESMMWGGIWIIWMIALNILERLPIKSKPQQKRSTF